MMLKVGNLVRVANEHGVIVSIKGDRALVSDNPFCSVMMCDFGVTLEYVRSISRCRWFNLTECELDDGDGYEEVEGE